jgi:hypothetical protein
MSQAAATPTAASALHRPRPEFADLAGLGIEQLLQRAAIGVEHFDPRVFNLSDEQLDTAFLPDSGVGRWPVRVLLGHLADAEMVLAHRMRRVVAEESPVFQVWDEQAFIDGGAYGAGVLEPGMPMPNIGAFVATVYTMRAWMCEWLSSLEARCWGRRGMHPEKGPQTLRQVCEYNTWHLENHAWYLNAKVERFLGVMPQGQGCGAGCGCHGGPAGADAAPSQQPADDESCGKPGCCKG